MIYMAAVVLLVILFTYFVTLYAFNQIARGRNFSEDDCFELIECRALYSRKEFEELSKEEVCITSCDGLKLRGFYIPGENGPKKTMIIVHGYLVAFSWSLQFVNMFRKRGWNVLVVDQRRHGRSEGRYTTYGFLEKDDLDRWVNWVVERNGSGCTIGLHGQSMGGGTVLEYCAINKHASFIIADCPYSDMRELIKHQIWKLNHVPPYPLLLFLDMMLKARAGFRLKDVSPIKAVRECSIPIMFIHGGEDNFVPINMSVKMYRAKKDGKRLLVIDGAKHGMSYPMASEKYEREVMKFVESVVHEQ